MHRAFYRLAHRVRAQIWRVWKPRLDGVRVLALDGQGRLLLVRHSYGSSAWMPPGGGLRRGEDPLHAGARELVEETGCRLENPQLLEVRPEDLHGADNRVRIVAGRAVGTPVPDGREIVASAFFALDALPEPLLKGHREALPLWAAQYAPGD
ncbi:NUDIX domain-containing protein [Novosphingobium sp. Leaf2]|uniref:NUDIX domain-containing protein n=1 Tax=Novosphingobium sp. Leaf2 TaxID=1735670 RepID=UPI001F207F06|nr:NUDIX domain-containing protein [Novosphingobium sp. Leaf2]